MTHILLALQKPRYNIEHTSPEHIVHNRLADQNVAVT